MTLNVEIRESAHDDAGPTKQLYREAFPDEDLFPVVSALQQEETGVLSLLATADDAVVGHVAFTTCLVGEGADAVALLAPLGVAPAAQRKGVGGALVREGLRRLETASVTHVYVLGDPAYYSRFGFRQEDRVTPPYDLPAEWRSAWQSLSLRGAGVPPNGRLVVPAPWRDEALWN